MLIADNKMPRAVKLRYKVRKCVFNDSIPNSELLGSRINQLCFLQISQSYCLSMHKDDTMYRSK